MKLWLKSLGPLYGASNSGPLATGETVVLSPSLAQEIAGDTSAVIGSR